MFLHTLSHRWQPHTLPGSPFEHTLKCIEACLGEQIKWIRAGFPSWATPCSCELWGAAQSQLCAFLCCHMLSRFLYSAQCPLSSGTVFTLLKWPNGSSLLRTEGPKLHFTPFTWQRKVVSQHVNSSLQSNHFTHSPFHINLIFTLNLIFPKQIKAFERGSQES